MIATDMLTHWSKRYRVAYAAWFARANPVPFASHGVPICKLPVVTKDSGMKLFIENYFKWTGHHAERTNNMGRPVQKYKPKYNLQTGTVVNVESGIEWQKGAGFKGTSDVKGHINNSHASAFPIPVYIEVKIGKDRQSKSQQKYEKRMSDTGALYAQAGTPYDVYSFFDYVMSL